MNDYKNCKNLGNFSPKNECLNVTQLKNVAVSSHYFSKDNDFVYKQFTNLQICFRCGLSKTDINGDGFILRGSPQVLLCQACCLVVSATLNLCRKLHMRGPYGNGPDRSVQHYIGVPLISVRHTY